MRIIGEISRAAGSADGMVGGQVLDLAAEGQQIAAEALDGIHAAKTGALLTASVVTGAIAGGARDEELERLGRYGRALGLAFQIADDVLDVTATEAELGKTPGKDRAAQKATYPALYGIEGSLARARDFAAEAVAALDGLGAAAEPLREIACFVVERRK
jgi:geranylgeranyl diphosphate synthase type II